MTFFLRDGKPCSRAYANLRGRRAFTTHRHYIERLWKLYEPLADRHFREDARKHFLQRYWEMYLAVALMANGARLARGHRRGHGPEFYFEHNGRRIWIEAIAPGPGTGADEVRENDVTNNYRVPVERILLRYTSAFAVKYEKLEADIAKGIIAPEDGYVLCINGGLIPYAYGGNTLPYFVQALLPIGSLELRFDVRTRQVIDRAHQWREQIHKHHGSPVSTRPLLDAKHSRVSAVLHSCANGVGFQKRLGCDFAVLHNPSADVRVSLDCFSQWQQYTWDDNRLTELPATRRTSRRRMSPALRKILRGPPFPVW